MKRRAFITLLGGAATSAWPLAVRAQQAPMPVIGVMHGVSAAQWTDRMSGFHRGLGEANLAEGRNLAIEYRWAEGEFVGSVNMRMSVPYRRELLALIPARADALIE